MKNERKRGCCATPCRQSRLKRRIRKMIEAARSPFERLCLLKWSFLDPERAIRTARPWERVVHCRFCGNWHLVNK